MHIAHFIHIPSAHPSVLYDHWVDVSAGETSSAAEEILLIHSPPRQSTPIFIPQVRELEEEIPMKMESLPKLRVTSENLIARMLILMYRCACPLL